MAYVIDPNKCSGCEKCIEACPVEAITNDGHGGYCIDPEICTDCGSCTDICPEDAVRGS